MTLPTAKEHAARVLGWAHLVAGAWLFVSAFLLSHTPQSSGNTWTMGLLVAACAVAALAGVERAIHVNAVFSAWLLVSTWIVPYAGSATRLHNALLALALLVLSVVPLRYFERGEGHEPQRATA